MDASVPLCHRLIDPFGTIHDLRYGATTIGRDQTADKAWPIDGSISRLHARIMVSSSEATIEDLGSRNGTLVNGIRISEEVLLQNGDVIQLGTTKLTYRASLT